MAALSFKVLVVDDEAHILELARLYLSREGYDVEGVGDGTQAMARFGQVKPDLVILDIMLAGTDGLTLCKEIRKQSQVPIIMLTARDEVTDKVVGLEVGADDYLTKPFHPQELVARAKALLRRARLEADQPKLIGRASSRSTSSATRCARAPRGSSSGRRSSTSSRCWRGIPAECSSAASCSTWCGATTFPGTHGPWTSTSSRCARSWPPRGSPTRASRRYGASATGWSWRRAEPPSPSARRRRRHRGREPAPERGVDVGAGA